MARGKRCSGRRDESVRCGRDAADRIMVFVTKTSTAAPLELSFTNSGSIRRPDWKKATPATRTIAIVSQMLPSSVAIGSRLRDRSDAVA